MTPAPSDDTDDLQHDELSGSDSDDATSVIDYREGVDPDAIELGPDAVAVDLTRPVERAVPDPGLASGVRPNSMAALAAVAAAFTVLGVGIGWLLADRADQPSAVDVGFTRDMIDHHDQAVQMALIALGKDDIDPIVRSFATEVIMFQRWEIGIMDTYLAEWNDERGDLDRQAMTWMGMGTPLQAMPGMQSDAEMQALTDATGTEADRLFLTMMREHHEGGVHMSDFAAANAEDSAVEALATRMARNQRVEVNEYTVLIEQLGLGS